MIFCPLYEDKAMIIQSENVWTGAFFEPAEIEFEENITCLHPHGKKTPDEDYGLLRIVPGFIDTHCHGAYGYDTNSGEPGGMKMWAKKIVHEGVTSFLPTTLTDDKQVLLKAVANVSNVMKEIRPGKDGARILGIHFEGPYLSKKYKGAQPEEYVVEPNVEEFKEYQAAAGGNIRLMTLAPEEDTNLLLTKYASSSGVVVSLGHTDATYEQGLAAVRAGAKSITHTFNAQTPLKHRGDGIVGLALSTDDLHSEMICDCLHVSPEVMRIFFKCKGARHGVMVSDALLCKGGKVGEHFRFGPEEVEIMPDTSAHIAGTDTIAGSTLKLNTGLRNLVERAGVPFESAINACTINPATLLGMTDRIGRLAAACQADMVVLTDDYEVADVYVSGVRQK